MSSTGHEGSGSNPWQIDETTQQRWRYALNAYGQYMTDEGGNYMREWARHPSIAADEDEYEYEDSGEEDDDDGEEEEEDDDGGEESGSLESDGIGLDGLHSGRNDSVVAANYPPNMAAAAPPDVRDRIAFKGTPETGWYEPLDSSYRVRTKTEEYDFFKPGRVFAMLWSEPAGETALSRRTDLTLHPGIVQGKHGERIFSSIRRFVVIRVNSKQHFVEACAITTYGGRATTKGGCNPSEHAIVYLKPSKHTKKPKTPKDEYALGLHKEPIAIVPSDPKERMSKKSRLRLGKTYSIECNVKVRDIGMIPREDRTNLLRYHKLERENGFEPDDLAPDTPKPGRAHIAMLAQSSAYPSNNLTPTASTYTYADNYTKSYGYQDPQATYSYSPQYTVQYSAAGQSSAPRSSNLTTSGYSTAPVAYGWNGSYPSSSASQQAPPSQQSWDTSSPPNTSQY